ncbi:Equilibrative nucleotide transporter 6 [Euphorbia peplus]|nr:Equilibrative nucleotide transporter 6 [Euphorbia peplus]
MLMLLLLDVVTSGKGGIVPFLFICAFVALFGVAEALVRGGMTGDLSCMCPKFLLSFYAGMATSGSLTAGLRLITKAIFDKSHNGLRKGVMLFLAISTFMEFLCILLYAFYFPKLPIVKYYRAKAASRGLEMVSSDLAATGIHEPESQDDSIQMERLSKKKLLLSNFDYLSGLSLVYVMTVFIIPGFLFENTGHHNLGSWYPVVLITVSHTWDLVGRCLPLLKWLKLESRKGLMLAILARFLLIPAFYFTAKFGDQGWMILLTSFLRLTNGYFTVCVITVAPKGYQGPNAVAIGNLLAVFLSVGMFVGVALDWLWMII